METCLGKDSNRCTDRTRVMIRITYETSALWFSTYLKVIMSFVILQENSF